MYVNLQSESGEDHELFLDVDRDLDWFATITIQDRESADIIDTWMIEPDEVPNFLAAVDRFRDQWERQTSAPAAEDTGPKGKQKRPSP